MKKILILFLMLPNIASAFTVSGAIIDPAGEPVVGVAITSPTKSSWGGTISDVNGKFQSTQNDFTDGDTIHLSYVGSTQTLPAKADLGTITLSIAEIEAVEVVECAKQPGADAVRRIDDVCKITRCSSGYLGPTNANECVKQESCDAPNAKSGEKRIRGGDIVCAATTCNDGYQKSGDKCVSDLTEEQSAARLDELKKNADDAKATEQSDANKILGAASMGAAGVGLGELMAGRAELRADDAAAREMQAHLNSFYCNFGGDNVAYGTADQFLPGAGNLSPLYREYTATADALKQTKTDLNLMPGIESEIVFDSGATGLYDDVSAGKTGGGTYASLSRALMDETGDDAAAIAAARSASQNRVTTGAVLAGAGVLGGIVGNQMINTANSKGNNLFGRPVTSERSREIAEKYKNPIKKATDAIAAVETTPATEPPLVEEGKEPAVVSTEPDSTDTGAPGIVNTPTDTPPAITPAEKPMKTIQGSALFASGAIDVKQPDGTNALDEIATELRELDAAVNEPNATWQITVTAYADKDRVKPNARYKDNQELTEKRAQSVVDYMVGSGIDASHFVAVGAGVPLDAGTTAAEKEHDRRVEISNFHWIEKQ